MIFSSGAKRAVLLTLAVTAAGCGGLPVAGPLASDVLHNNGRSNPAHVDYVVIEVTPQVCGLLAQSPSEVMRQTFGNLAAPPVYAIHVGDTLSVSVWEAGSSGLFTSTQALNGVPVPRGTTLPPLVVEQDGAIALPFVGRIVVAGKPPSEAEKLMASALSGKAETPQVVVTIAKSDANTAAVGGEVGRGARVPLAVNGERILDAIAEAGGVRISVSEAQVRLTRDRRAVSISYGELLRNPDENVYLESGDVITVVHSPKTFTSFGAFGRNYQIPFETDTLSLEEAIAKSGGIQDQRADPAGIFVLRYEPAELVSRLAPESKVSGPSVPVVFHLDMSHAGSYFLARSFSVQEKDIVYAANAELNEVQKFLSLVGSVLSPAATGAAVGASLR